MLRVNPIYASTASASAAYYTQYLTGAPGEEPGRWCGRQAEGVGLSGRVEAGDLEALLSGRGPATGTPLGRELVRYTGDGRQVTAVAGFDATFSAPKSLSVWWALTGDRRLLEAHDIAVTAALQHLERFGATTRIRSNGRRLHPDTNGLTMARFRQTTSREDDPQLHTHVVISSKVQTVEGRWMALDARYLTRNQRVLGGLYESVLRAELTHRFGVAWDPIVNGIAEIAGAPTDLLALFSKRAAVIDRVVARRVAEFRTREGRDPTAFELNVIGRKVAANTRSRKSGNGVADLVTRWHDEAADAGWTADRYREVIDEAARDQLTEPEVLHVGDVIDARDGLGRIDVDVPADGERAGCRHVARRVVDQQRLGRFRTEAFERQLERAAIRLGHADLARQHELIDEIVQAETRHADPL